uniref:peptidylprolyl isomerase n=1 Tax=Phaeomonas parva TaxID=124430 RepID=A0A7S1U697_9STRA|mmetsp:Transcript_33635/g.106306  ORF Transcript_33635/g.106306 Transcript_33635/m.106306 type:complete len:243 (+) Transcript_33635:113-841(+)|eukprot:CAMPEP_0118860924 /NCGR_PEP_ID=MMETSP1163-20130328/6619_1 /TAXON_ID=124430 /ORGANISM="Phaeomonas parva, Strain CCMP2877" /LENGTH=242 /DNA_ID=CAMNT_0006794679 /DNA_START=50 /DNA_END=778 /DNA_ORIENTATION=+
MLRSAGLCLVALALLPQQRPAWGWSVGPVGRRQLLRDLAGQALVGAAAAGVAPAGANAFGLPGFGGGAFPSAAGKPGFQTESGVKYYELTEGSGPTPQWGDTTIIKFTQYISRSANDEPVKIEDWNGNNYVFKHGNGRQLEGLEDGIHSMKIGTTRRIIVPARLAYTTNQVGPLPRSTANLQKLTTELDAMVNGGQIIFDVTLVNTFRDEADRGYYADETPAVDPNGVPINIIKGSASKDAL